MNFRRYYVPNSMVFITQVVNHREPIFHDLAHLELLKAVLHNIKVLHPFEMLAYGFLPDHFHGLIKPTGVSNFSKIMRSLKSTFTKQYKERDQRQHEILAKTFQRSYHSRRNGLWTVSRHAPGSTHLVAAYRVAGQKHTSPNEVAYVRIHDTHCGR